MDELNDIISGYHDVRINCRTAWRRHKYNIQTWFEARFRLLSRWYIIMLAVIALCNAVILLLLFSLLEKTQSSSSQSDIIDDLFDIGGASYQSVHNLTQEELDHFAKTIEVKYTVLENGYRGEKQFLAEIKLTNHGKRVLPPFGWAIIFTQPYTVEPDEFPYPEGLDKPEFGVHIKFFTGNVYQITPIAGFGSVPSGSSKVIQLVSQYHCVSRTDVHPNWYFAGSGLKPRVIESTRGESLDFVSPFNTSAMWKRTPNINDNDYDTYNPFTPNDRYARLYTPDMGSAPIPVIPTPFNVVSFNPSSNLTVDGQSWAIFTSPRLANEARYLGERLGVKIVLRKPDHSFIQFVETNVEIGEKAGSVNRLVMEEAYEISVDSRSKIIVIRTSTPAGAFNAIQTLLALQQPDGSFPDAMIQDAPRFRYRGLMLDVARNFQSKEKILRYIDVMAMYKLNKLHLHLTDDEGWRIEIPGLEELTEVGARRCHDLQERKCLLPFLGSGPNSGPPGSGFYSVGDYREILRYATERHIEVIPEIDMPAHSHAAVTAMEERHRRLASVNFTEATRFILSDLNDASQYLSIQSFNDGAVNPCLRSTYRFIARVLRSLVAMHRDINPLRMYNFGGDEVPEGTWELSPACNQLKQTGSISEPKRYMVNQIADLTAMYNLDLAAWEDGITIDGKPMNRQELPNRNVFVYTWNNVWEWGGQKHAYDFANKGFRVVMTPATNLYLDHPYEPDPEERGLFWATRYSDTKKVFSTMPENLYMNADTYRSGQPIDICKDDQCPPLRRPENIEGIQGSLFGELLRTQAETDFMLLPRMLALAERAWHKAPWESESNKARMLEGMEKEWQRFANTLGHRELARLDRLGLQYRIPPPGARVENGTINISATFPGLPVEMSDNNGRSWQSVDSSGLPITSDKQYLLRTRAPFGERYSREIALPNMASHVNSYSSTLVSLVVFLVTVTTDLW